MPPHETPEITMPPRATAPETSDARPPGVGIPTPGGDASAVAAVRKVGARFLRLRPLVVLPVAIVNAASLATRPEVPPAQRAALATAIGLALALFTVEAWVFRRQPVSERWLATSLGLTLVGLAVGCGLSGGIASPLVPLLTAPIVVAFAAFGRRTPMLALGAAVAVALAALPDVFPPLPLAAFRTMVLASLAGAILLAYAGVSGLVDAHAETARALDRMRLATLEEAASRMRATEQIGAKVAHELKNPLAAIRALVQLLASGEDDPRTKKRLEVALAEVDRMDTIVRDYLAFTRPLADLAHEPLDALALATDVADVLEARALAAGVTLATEGSSARIVGDPRRLREALLNLADNAVAATPRGGSVRVTVAETSRGARLEVADTGPGMTSSPDGPFTTKAGGTGLGLVLARAAIRQHGGTIAFSSREPSGTIVTIDLPREPSPPEMP